MLIMRLLKSRIWLCSQLTSSIIVAAPLKYGAVKHATSRPYNPILSAGDCNSMVADFDFLHSELSVGGRSLIKTVTNARLKLSHASEQ